MYQKNIFCTISLVFSIFSIASACKGCVELDEQSLKRILPKFDAVLIKFDENFPIGEKQDIFSSVAEETINNEHILLAQVPIDVTKDINKKFNKKHGILTNDDLPKLKLFVRGKDEPFVYEKDKPWSNENLKTFIRNHTNFYWGLPGRLEAFDQLAIKFVYTNDKKFILREAERKAKTLYSEESVLPPNVYVSDFPRFPNTKLAKYPDYTAMYSKSHSMQVAYVQLKTPMAHTMGHYVKLKIQEQKNIANIYIKFMDEIIKSGFPTVFEERQRIENRQEELSHRLNIVKLFTTDPANIPL